MIHLGTPRRGLPRFPDDRLMDAGATIARCPAAPDVPEPRLARIAELTGVPVEAFLAGPGPAARADLGELIRLWDAIGDEPARARLLACARAVADGITG